MASPKIAVILPRREGFTENDFGAISLCVRDNTLNSKFHNSTIIYGGKTKKSKAFSDVEYRYIPAKRSILSGFIKNLSYAKNLVKSLKADGIDIVEVHNRPQIANFLQKKLKDKKICQHFHNDPVDMIKNENGKNSAMFYCVSDYIKNRLLTITKHPNIKVIYNGLKTPINAKFPAKKQIIFVGKINEFKGAIPTLLALEKSLKKHSDWKGIFIGGMCAGEKEYFEKFEEIIKRVPDNIKYIGLKNHHEVMKILCESEIAILPSYWQEPFGRTILEAMAAKCAVITCANGGIPEVVGESAIIVKNHDINDLENKITALIENDDLRAKTAGDLYERAKDKFDIVKTTEYLDECREENYSSLSIKKGIETPLDECSDKLDW